MSRSMTSDEVAVLPWRIVAGAFLHFIVPAYVIGVPLACLFAAPKDATVEQLLGLALPFSGWFLAGYAAATVIATLAAAAIDPALRARRRRRDELDPRVAAAGSERRLARAVAEGGGALGGRAPALLVAIRDAHWDHGDPRYQALSSDLAQIVRTSVAACATASAESRGEIADIAAVSLARIERALQALITERGRLDAGDARTVARYVELRYGPSDFAGDGP